MKPALRRLFFVVSAMIASTLLVASLAQAQMREFTGRIDRISKTKMIVDNRMGDKVSFVPADDVAVSGEEKTKWGDLKKGDWVTVSWKFVDKPRKAYLVAVLPPKDEEGEDE